MHIKRLLLIFIPLVGGFKSYIGDEEETGSYHVIDIIQLRTITECHMRCERHERCMFIGVKDGPDDYRSCSLMREKEIGGAGTTQTASVGEQGSSPVVVKPTATVIKKISGDVTMESQIKNLPLPIDGWYGAWSEYTVCDATCGGGRKFRNRSCDSPAPQNGGCDCVGASNQSTECNTQPCPVHGSWGTWSSYGTCSTSCNGGIQKRTRSCDSPSPSHGGIDCLTKDATSRSTVESETKTCSTQPCPVAGGWSAWTSFSSCSYTCGRGSKSRSRTCSSPPPAHGGADCVKQDGTTSSGTETQSQSCNANSCPVAGGWSAWTSFSSCSRTCGGGSKSRSRTCSSPPPAHGGADCVKQDGTTSSATETLSQSCNANSCPVAGGWSSWTSFSSCSRTCGGGSKSRSRTCSSPPPAHGGADCMKQDGTTSSGTEMLSRSCNTNSCPVTYSCIFSPGGGNDYYDAGKLLKDACIAECIHRKKTDSTYNGVGIHANEATAGCWCLKNMPNRNTATVFKSCVLTPN